MKERKIETVRNATNCQKEQLVGLRARILLKLSERFYQSCELFQPLDLMKHLIWDLYSFILSILQPSPRGQYMEKQRKDVFSQ